MEAEAFLGSLSQSNKPRESSFRFSRILPPPTPGCHLSREASSIRACAGEIGQRLLAVMSAESELLRPVTDKGSDWGLTHLPRLGGGCW